MCGCAPGTLLVGHAERGTHYADHSLRLSRSPVPSGVASLLFPQSPRGLTCQLRVPQPDTLGGVTLTRFGGEETLTICGHGRRPTVLTLPKVDDIRIQIPSSDSVLVFHLGMAITVAVITAVAITAVAITPLAITAAAITAVMITGYQNHERRGRRTVITNRAFDDAFLLVTQCVRFWGCVVITTVAYERRCIHSPLR
eukprot:gene10840-biopygen1086